MAKAKRPRWKLVLDIVILLVVGISLVFADSFGIGGLFVPITGDSMDWKSSWIAGWRSENCGRARINQDPTDASKCGLEAFSAGRPFRVIYNLQGIDSSVAAGIVRTRDGRLFSLSFDGCGSGCGFSYLLQRATVHACPQPYHLYVNPKGHLNCYQPQLATPGNIMSPNAESY